MLLGYYAASSANSCHKPTSNVEVLGQYSCFSCMVEEHVVREKISLTSNLSSSSKEGEKHV